MLDGLTYLTGLLRRLKLNQIEVLFTLTGEETSMRNIMIPSALIVAALLSAPTMGEELKSGLQVGDSAGAFNVKDCTGPNKGKSLCYR